MASEHTLRVMRLYRQALLTSRHWLVCVWFCVCLCLSQLWTYTNWSNFCCVLSLSFFLSHTHSLSVVLSLTHTLSINRSLYPSNSLSFNLSFSHSLFLSLMSHQIYRDLWRQSALEIRDRFEANRNERNHAKIQSILSAAEVRVGVSLCESLSWSMSLSLPLSLK